LLLAACEPLAEPVQLPTPVENTAEVVIDEPTLEIATPTELAPKIPLAAKVNGVGILLSDYERETQIYRASFTEGQTLPSEEEIKETVLTYLIEQQLLVNAARQSGYSLTDEALEQKISELINEAGGQEQLNIWMQNNFHTMESLRETLRLTTEAAHQRDQIISEVPLTTEQVRARQIFSVHQGDAIDAERSLAAGTDFEQVAWKYSPESGGELGWFPRGFLLFPEIEEQAFSLPVGARSPIIQTELGYHIIYIIAHENDHPLTTDARVMLQNKALEAWLKNAREQAEIEILIP
jgi:peptidyl-prolyl cis-trans isomerase C